MPRTRTLNAATPQLIQIRPQEDGTGWEVLIDLLIGARDPATGEFTGIEREAVEANLAGLTNAEKTTLITILGKVMMSHIKSVLGATSLTRAGRVWYES